MENIILSSSIFMLALLAILFVVGKDWNKSFLSFLFADRSLQIGSTGLAISAHWFWAIAIFVGPAVAYNWGFIGLLWFVIPNALSLLVVGFITHRIRDRYPDGYSLTQYVKDNFSSRVSGLYQLEFALVAFAALILAFTAISKLWAFANLGGIIEPVYASLGVGLVTLAFTLRGGIRTSIFTGSIQTVLWLICAAIITVVMFNSDGNYFSLGKNNLESFFTDKFITTFAVAWFISVMVGATGHGMMWQKSFSMPKENILPAYAVGAIAFALVTYGVGQLGMYAFANNFDVKAPDTSHMVTMVNLLGTTALVVFATILVGQTSTVIDSALNYISSYIAMDWAKEQNVTVSRIAMIAFMTFAWLISWFKIDIWTIVMLMGCVRISMFMPVFLHSLNVRLRESAVFYGSAIAVLGNFYMSYIARIEKLPVYDMYGALWALLIPTTVLLLTREKQN